MFGASLTIFKLSYGIGQAVFVSASVPAILAVAAVAAVTNPRVTNLAIEKIDNLFT